MLKRSTSEDFGENNDMFSKWARYESSLQRFAEAASSASFAVSNTDPSPSLEKLQIRREEMDCLLMQMHILYTLLDDWVPKERIR